MKNPATITAATADAVRAALAAYGINPADAVAALTAEQTDEQPARPVEIGTRCRIHITHHSERGKLADGLSIGTPVTLNPRCQARRKCSRAICAQCYADAETRRKPGLMDGLTRNAEILTAGILTPEETPAFPPAPFVRVESFGDSIDSTHAANYILSARRNPGRRFGVWSKNPDHYRAALDIIGGTWPENLSFVYSVPVTDPDDVDGIAARMKSRYPFIQYVFAVFTDRAKARAAGHPVSCAHRQCRTCLTCYTPRPLDAAPVVVVELLKAVQANETRRAYAAARAYMATGFADLSKTARGNAGSAAVTAAAAALETAAARIGTDPDPDEITVRAVATLAARFRLTSDALSAAIDAAARAGKIPAATLAAAVADALTA